MTVPARVTELPGADRPRTKSAPTPLAAVVGRIVPPLPAAPITRLELQRTHIRRLEELDGEISAFLAKCAPDTWADVRPALWRILRRARRELRATERRLEARA